ncbi:MAG: hypothetical protein JWL84_2627 [Rhodospirillales bacterium]|jgi:hypothetical protein|nr:hypothetical protein [Rhodospirillales bacterium]
MVVDVQTRDAVLGAFRLARAGGKDPFACYRAAVDAWCFIHPEHRRTQAARCAVEVVQQSLGSLRDMAKDRLAPPR